MLTELLCDFFFFFLLDFFFFFDVLGVCFGGESKISWSSTTRSSASWVSKTSDNSEAELEEDWKSESFELSTTGTLSTVVMSAATDLVRGRNFVFTGDFFRRF